MPVARIPPIPLPRPAPMPVARIPPIPAARRRPPYHRRPRVPHFPARMIWPHGLPELSLSEVQDFDTVQLPDGTIVHTNQPNTYILDLTEED